MNNTFRFRSMPVQAGLRPKVDREKLLIRDVVSMEVMESKDWRPISADRKTLAWLRDLGNQSPKGITSRFGHPGISAGATGMKVATAVNFRLRDQKLIHDSQLFPPARRSPKFSNDPLEYIMEAAEGHPDHFMQSVVIEAYTVWVLDDGTEIEAYGEDGPVERPDNAINERPALRPVAFHATDYVAEGALTNSMFSSADDESMLGEEAFELVDRWRSRYGIPLERVPEKVNNILHRYLNARRRFDLGAMIMADEMNEEVVEEQPDELEQALNEATALNEQLNEQPDETADLAARVVELETETAVLREDYEALNRGYDDLSQRLGQLNSTLSVLQSLALANQQNIAILGNEPIARRRVGQPAGVQLEAATYHTAPRPPASLLQQQGNGRVTDAVATDLERQALRRKQMGR